MVQEEGTVTKRLNLLFVVLAASLMLASTSFAQKIGYINSQQILAEFEEAKTAQKTLDDLNKEWESQGMEMQQKLQEIGEQLEQQSLLLSEERKREKQQEMQQLYQQLQQFQQETWGPSGKLAQEEQKVMKPIIDKINEAIKKVGEEEDYDYIFDTVSANIVYASPSQTDLTQQVLDVLERGVENTTRN